MNKHNETLTLEKIGKLSGVSRSTVSRVLNNHPDVRPEVRTRVEAVIEKTGYTPNQAARALVSSKSDLIGLLMPTDTDELFGDPYYSALVGGIQRGCAETNTAFAILPIPGASADELILPSVVSRAFLDGVIATASPRSDRMIATLRDRGANIVAVGSPADRRGLRRVDVDNRGGAELAVTHLASLGRTRIGFIGPTLDHIYGAQRRDGYLDGLQGSGLPATEHLMTFGPPTKEGGYSAARLLAAHDIDAVFVATDQMAVGALHALSDEGISVPRDIALVGFDGLPNAAHTEVELTTIVQPADEVGRLAAHRLVSEDGPEETILDVSIRVGDSCGARIR